MAAPLSSWKCWATLVYELAMDMSYSFHPFSFSFLAPIFCTFSFAALSLPESIECSKSTFWWCAWWPSCSSRRPGQGIARCLPEDSVSTRPCRLRLSATALAQREQQAAQRRRTLGCTCLWDRFLARRVNKWGKCDICDR